MELLQASFFIAINSASLTNVASVAGGIANREESRLIFYFRFSKGFHSLGNQSTGLWACWSR
jgi:hypothetical protein